MTGSGRKLSWALKETSGLLVYEALHVRTGGAYWVQVYEARKYGMSDLWEWPDRKAVELRAVQIEVVDHVETVDASWAPVSRS